MAESGDSVIDSVNRDAAGMIEGEVGELPITAETLGMWGGDRAIEYRGMGFKR
jgi:hypothetical protein